MPMWRCPHCGTPQPEASRCWVCHRSSTICSTCRHFRRSLAASVGYCGLDARRAPLHGTEHRGCWTEGRRELAPVESMPGRPSPTLPPDITAARLDTPVARLRSGARPRDGLIEGFVPVDQLDPTSASQVPARRLAPRDPAAPRRPAAGEPGSLGDPVEPPSPSVIESAERWADRETLFGDFEG